MAHADDMTAAMIADFREKLSQFLSQWGAIARKPGAAALLLLLSVGGAQASAEATSAGFDSALAAELGADEYGMRKYVFVLLRAGPTEIADSEQRRELFAGHFANMNRLAERGELVLAGPLDAESDWRGIFILNADSIEAASAMVADDPAVAAGVFVADFSLFYGSAALMRINALHERIQRKSIN